MGCKRHGKSSSGGGVAAVAAVVVGCAMASGAHHGGKAAHPAVVADAVAPPPAAHVSSGHVTGMPGGYSVGKWTVWFLSAAHMPDTPCDRAAVDRWQAAEDTYAKFKNPLDSERVLPGSVAVNSTGPGQGVQKYPTWAEGMHATVITLFNGRYPGVIAALRAGNNAEAVARAVWVPHVWGTEPFSATC
jgi:hypothetical protein